MSDPIAVNAVRALGVAEGFDPWSSWTDLPIAVMDCETTGTDPALGDRVIEVGVVVGRCDFRGVVVHRRLNWLVHPGMPIPASASRVHGITDADVAHAPRFADVAEEVAQALQNVVPGAYNAGFDRAFLVAEFVRSGRCIDTAPPCVRIGFPADRIRWVDPLVWARHLQAEEKGKKLGEVAARLGVPVGREHRAADDAEVALRILWCFSQDLRVPSEYAAMVREQRKLEVEQQSARRW